MNFMLSRAILMLWSQHQRPDHTAVSWSQKAWLGRTARFF